jgi:hypothetical protein
MVRVCAEPTCKTSARFNEPGQLRGMFCSKHRQAGMVDVVHARCAVQGCDTLASFNVQGLPRGVLCSQHKQARRRGPGPTVGDLRLLGGAPPPSQPQLVSGAGSASQTAVRVRDLQPGGGQSATPDVPKLALRIDVPWRRLLTLRGVCARAGRHGEREAPPVRAPGLRHAPRVQLPGGAQGRLLQQAQGGGHDQRGPEGAGGGRCAAAGRCLWAPVEPHPDVRCSCATAPSAPSPWRDWCCPPCLGSQPRSSQDAHPAVSCPTWWTWREEQQAAGGKHVLLFTCQRFMAFGRGARCARRRHGGRDGRQARAHRERGCRRRAAAPGRRVARRGRAAAARPGTAALGRLAIAAALCTSQAALCRLRGYAPGWAGQHNCACTWTACRPGAAAAARRAGPAGVAACAALGPAAAAARSRRRVDRLPPAECRRPAR